MKTSELHTEELQFSMVINCVSQMKVYEWMERSAADDARSE
jgi:hypothetical protein